MKGQYCLIRCSLPRQLCCIVLVISMYAISHIPIIHANSYNTSNTTNTTSKVYVYNSNNKENTTNETETTNSTKKVYVYNSIEKTNTTNATESTNSTSEVKLYNTTDNLNTTNASATKWDTSSNETSVLGRSSNENTNTSNSAYYESNENDLLVARQFVPASPPTGVANTPASAPFVSMLQNLAIPTASNQPVTGTFRPCGVCPLGQAMTRAMERVTGRTVNFILIDLQCIDIERIAQRAEFSPNQCMTIRQSSIPTLCGCSLPAARTPITYRPTSPPVPSKRPTSWTPTLRPDTAAPTTRRPSSGPTTAYPTTFEGASNAADLRDKIVVSAKVNIRLVSVTGRMPDSTLDTFLNELSVLLNENLNSPSNPFVSAASNINATYLNQVLNTKKDTNETNSKVRRQLQSSNNDTSKSSSAMPLYPLDVYVQFFGWVMASSSLRDSPRLFPAQVMNVIETNQDSFIKTLQNLPGIIDPLFFRTTTDIIVTEITETKIQNDNESMTGGIITLIACMVVFGLACIVAAVWFAYRLLLRKQASKAKVASDNGSAQSASVDKQKQKGSSIRKNYISLASNHSESSSIQSAAPPPTGDDVNTTQDQLQSSLSVRRFTTDAWTRIRSSFGSSLTDPENVKSENPEIENPPSPEEGDPLKSVSAVAECESMSPSSPLSPSSPSLITSSFMRIRASLGMSSGQGSDANKRNLSKNSEAANSMLLQASDADAAIDNESKQGEEIVSSISSRRRLFFGKKIAASKRSESESEVNTSNTNDSDAHPNNISERNDEDVQTSSPPSELSDDKSNNNENGVSEQLPFFGDDEPQDAMSYTYSLGATTMDNRTYMNIIGSGGPGTLSASIEDLSSTDGSKRSQKGKQKRDKALTKSSMGVSLSSIVAASSSNVANIFKSAFGPRSRSPLTLSNDEASKDNDNSVSRNDESTRDGDDSKDEINDMYRNHESMISRTVLAPAGKLGIVIDTSIEGPVVHRVFATSPLEGKIFVGDIITGIDDIDTRTMSAVAISELMIKTAFQPRKLTVLSEDNLGIKDIV